jgi:hypothetical protein
VYSNQIKLDPGAREMLIAVHPDVVTLMSRHDKAGIIREVLGTPEAPIIDIDDETHGLFSMLCLEGQTVADFLYDQLYKKSARRAWDAMKN